MTEINVYDLIKSMEEKTFSEIPPESTSDGGSPETSSGHDSSQVEEVKKDWGKIIVLCLMSIFLLSGVFYAGYWLGSQKEKVEAPERAVPTSTQVLIATPTPNPTANWKTYTNTKYKYSIKIPPDWGQISAHTGEVLPGLTSDSSSELIGDGRGFSPQAIEIEVKSNFTKEQFLKEHKQTTVECRETEEDKILCGYTRFLIQKDEDLYTISDVRGLSNFDQILSTFKFLD